MVLSVLDTSKVYVGGRISYAGGQSRCLIRCSVIKLAVNLNTLKGFYKPSRLIVVVYSVVFPAHV